MKGSQEDICSRLATLSEHLRKDEDGCFPGLNNNPLILCAAHIHELSLLIQQLQLMDATHRTNLAELEARLTQTDLHLNKAIEMAAAKSQGV